MKKYQCHKIVEAEPAIKKGGKIYTEGDIVPRTMEPVEEGYRVVYEDGYVSWSPKKAFEDGYTEILSEPKSIGKTLDISEVKGAKANISDLKVYGDGDTFALLCKASSQDQGWMKSTKVCNVYGGCVIQVTTQQRNPDGSYAVAEALTYVPGVNINKDANPRRLVKI